MTFHKPNGFGGPAPAYRLAPNTPAEIAADFARLVAETTAPAAESGTVPDSAEPSRGRDGHSKAPRSSVRRLALFGAAAALLAPLASRPAAARVAEADRRLVDLARRVEAQLADVIPVFHEGHDAPEQNAKLDAVDALYVEMAKIEATGPVGLAAKARAFRAGHRYDVQEGFELSNSLAYDVLQLGGVAA